MKRFIISLVALASASALAQDNQIRLGTPAMGGSGCPAGTASATLSPDNTSLSILFDQYAVAAGGITGKSVERKACNIAIPVHVPQGFSVSIVQVDYRGFNSLPQSARSQFNVEYFFAGGQGPRVQRNFFGSQSQDFLISNQLQLTALVWSQCGADTILRTNSSMMVSSPYGEEAQATVDSADISAGIRYLLQWKRC